MDARAPGRTDAGPRHGSATTGSATVAGGSVSNAARVVAGMRAGFRNCYNRALTQNAAISGSVTLVIRVGSGGEVQGVTVSAQSGNLPDSVVSCVKARAQAAQFDPPVGDAGLATITVPVTFPVP
jgi:TonB family protein